MTAAATTMTLRHDAKTGVPRNLLAFPRVPDLPSRLASRPHLTRRTVRLQSRNIVPGCGDVTNKWKPCSSSKPSGARSAKQSGIVEATSTRKTTIDPQVDDMAESSNTEYAQVPRFGSKFRGQSFDLRPAMTFFRPQTHINVAPRPQSGRPVAKNYLPLRAAALLRRPLSHVRCS